MRPRRYAARSSAAEIFDSAVAENALAVVTLQDGHNWTSFKCRFLERDPQQRFFVLDFEPSDEQPLPALSAGQYAGISFRYRSRKILFASVVEAKGKYLRSNNATVAAIRYRWPDTLTELQRRAYYRTPIPPGVQLTAQVWPGGTAARKNPDFAHTPLHGTLADLSCGGGLIRITQAAPAWRENETLGLELHLADGRSPLLVDARYRGMRGDENGHPCIAIQFLGLEVSVDGRVTLQRLARCVQRFHRLGRTAGAIDNPFRVPE